MSDGGWFAPLDDEDRQNLVRGFITVGVGVAATLTGQPWLMFAAAPLQVLTKRARRMWTGVNNRPTRAFAVGGQQSLVTYQPFSGVDVNVTPLLQRRTARTQEIAGQFITSDVGGQGLRQGDPVALVINSTSWRSQNNGVVVPAKFGEPFRVRVPRDDYSLSAYSLDSRRQPRVDPVTAIGVGHLLLGAALATPIVLRQRQAVMTRSLLADLRRQSMSVKTTNCPHCGIILYVRFFLCFNCGRLILDNANATKEHKDSFEQILRSFTGGEPLEANPSTQRSGAQSTTMELLYKDLVQRPQRTAPSTTHQQGPVPGSAEWAVQQGLPQPYVRYGAIAYSKSTGRYGVGWDLQERALAEWMARSTCGTSDAFVVCSGWNTFLALAVGSGGEYGWAWGGEKAQDCAQRAREFCLQESSSATVKVVLDCVRGEV